MRVSAISIDWYSGAVNDLSLIAAQEQDDTSNVFRLRPLGKVGVGHGFPVHCRVDEAGENRVHPDSSTLQVCCQRIHHRHRSGFPEESGRLDGMLEQALQAARDQREKSQADLFELIRIPSVSALSEHSDDCRRAALPESTPSWLCAANEPG